MHKIILASGSATRKKMLTNAGLEFECEPAQIDEEKLLHEMQKKRMPPRHIAETLAQEKALAVSKLHPYALVIGADQILECEGETYTKAANAEEACTKLKKLSGKSHRLISAVCVAREEKPVWGESDEALLHMGLRDETFWDQYCKKAGGVLTSCVGAYAIEEHGIWLFDKIEGDYFTILGLPLLPLLNHLREKQGIEL